MHTPVCITTTPREEYNYIISSYRSSIVKIVVHVRLLARTLSCTIHMPLAFTSIHAGLPTVTSLTFDDQSRTLVCTSTGGPPTTVTWRRDGVVITLNTTYQQTKRVVNSVNGTYQTALTIDPSVGQIVGTYNCTVENDRGESSESVVAPGET